MGERKSKKRKAASTSANDDKKRKLSGSSADSQVDTSKPTAVFVPTSKPRQYTLSLALPSSILSNAQSHELKTHLAAAIARAAAVFCVDEIVLFSDGADAASQKSTDMLVHILSYLETPQYLRKHLFQIHHNLKSAGLLAPLDIPSHLRFEEPCLYREGISVESAGSGKTLVEVGLERKVLVEADIPLQSRLTVKFRTPEEGGGKGCIERDTVPGTAVSPDTPRLESGYYWGYQLRTAPSLSAVFTESTFEGGYDVTLGTSERGEDIGEVINREGEGSIPKFQHMLVAFGGLAGLEQAFKADKDLIRTGVHEVKDIFDFWVNVCPGQGSRTIRTEEALWVALSRLKDTVTIKGMQS